MEDQLKNKKGRYAMVEAETTSDTNEEIRVFVAVCA